MPDDAFVPNLVKIGRETAEQNYREKKAKQTDGKNIIITEILKN